MKMRIAVATNITALVLTAGSALAADAPAPVYNPPAPPAAPGPVYSVSTGPMVWGGFYIGLNGGYRWGHLDQTTNLLNSTTGLLLATAGTEFTLKGAVFGAQGGYNWQAGSLVFGVETDIQGSREKAATTVSCSLATCSVPSPPGVRAATVALSQSMDWFGTLRGRLGTTISPAAVLLYATGGLAYGEVKSASLVSGFAGATAVSVAASTNTIHTGWTAGGGIEGQIFGHWTGKIEYLYVDLGSESSSGTLLTSSPQLLGNFSSKITNHIFRGGINYKF
jgi:outer membrane immunogenic protein